MREAIDLYWKLLNFLLGIGHIGLTVLFCAILTGLLWAYARVSPLTPAERRLSVTVPIVWVVLLFLAAFRSFGYVFIVGLWIYPAYVVALMFSLRRIRFFVFFSSLLFLSAMIAVGFVMVAMTFQL